MGIADHFRNDNADKLIKKAETEMEKIGLYLRGAKIDQLPDADPDDPDAPLFLHLVLQIGERAVAPGALEEDPLVAEEAAKFAELERMFNDPTHDVRQEIAQGLKGGGILALDDDIDDILG